MKIVLLPVHHGSQEPHRPLGSQIADRSIAVTSAAERGEITPPTGKKQQLLISLTIHRNA